MTSNLRVLVFGLGMAGLGAVGGAGLTAIAGPGGPGGHGARGGMPMPGMKLAHGMSQLDLTAAQAGMLDALRADMRAELRALRGEGEGDKEALVAAVLREGAVDRAALHADLDAAAAERLSLAHTFLDRVLDVRDTLSAEQLAELRELAAEHEARRAERGEGHGDDEGRRPGRR